MSDTPTRVLFLRHGEVASHRGDVPVTEGGLVHAEESGRAIGRATDAPVTLLFGGTRRSRETAEAVARGIGDGTRVDGPIDSFALRNPDMYVAGTRVNMVSSPEALAEQVPGLTAEDAAANPWWADFFASPDRIGWWLGQDDPPGETVDALTRRVLAFARTIADPGPLRGRLVIAVTHSPLLRGILQYSTGSDPGEPAYVTGAEVLVTPDGRTDIAPYDPLHP